MFQSSDNQFSAHTKTLSIQNSSALLPVDVNETCIDDRDNLQNGGFSQAESIIRNFQKLQDDLHMLGMKIKQHEDNLNLLKTQRNKLDDSILALQVTTGNYHSSSTAKLECGDNFHSTSEEEINEQILRQEKSAAGILCQLKTHHGAQASLLTLTKDVVGVVASLGKVEDENLSQLFSEYLGEETMLAIVCKTNGGLRALEMYDEEGCIDKSSGLHGLGSSIGRSLDGRFLVICLESLRPYAGQFVVDDPQKKLDILNPRLPNGECPAGFLGFAVNMINIDNSKLFCVTPSGYGLRETLFYSLFSRLQVYKTRAEMIQALPCISDGALSLDGGMIRSSGVYSLGNREAVDVRFPRPGRSMGSDVYIENERQLTDIKWKKEKILDDIRREQTLFDAAKFNFNKKKNEFLKFLAESSSYATQEINNNRVVPLDSIYDNKEGDSGISACCASLNIVNNDNEGDGVVSSPFVGMIFDSEEGVKEYYKRYANQQGFDIMTRSSRKGNDGKLTYFTLACSREGINKPRKTCAVRIAPSKKQKCDAKINACLCEGGAYRISSVMLHHNHDLSPSKSRLFKNNLNIDMKTKRTLDLNDRAEQKFSITCG